MSTREDDDFTFNGTTTFAGPVVMAGTVDISSATLANMPRRYVSQSIVHGALTGGSATCTVALTGEPTTGMMPIACYAVTSATTTSGDGSTTGLTVKIGTSGDDDGYLQEISIFGAAGRKEGASGVMIGGYRGDAEALIATFTATGGAADCAHITALALKIVVVYIAPYTE